MSTIQDQLQWEKDMRDRGVSRFRAQQLAAKDTRAHETSAGSSILRGYVLTISDHISLYLEGKHPEGRRRNKYAQLVKTIDTDKVSMITLRQVIGAVFGKPRSLASMCISIGRSCEDELRFMHFQTEYKEYYDTLIRDFDRKNISSYNHKRTVLVKKGNDKGLVWKDWSKEDRLGVGAVILSLVIEVTDLLKKTYTYKGNKSTAHIVPTDECIEWIKKHDSFMELTSPDHMPCLVPPADWVTVTDGGYYIPEMRDRTPLIKTTGGGEYRKALYANAEMPAVLDAINSMQKTAWRVNTAVMDVMREVWAKNLSCGMPRSEPYDFPEAPIAEDVDVNSLPLNHPDRLAFGEWKADMRELYTKEKERVAKNLALVRTMRMAGELSTRDAFWYVYQCDFRGRVYSASNGLSPQGTDHAKGLIEFAEGKRLGQRGLYWFKVNGANKYGNDKGSYDDRVKWVDDNRDKWRAVGEDPIGNRALWADADKPYQFLAWCIEFEKMSRQPYPATFVSHLPVGLDGSCNGLQHFSAMLRDEIGGKAVNLVPSETPADIYQVVADTCQEKLHSCQKDGDGGAVNWLSALPDNKVPRSLTKKPVMTLPYGAVQQSCTQSIYSWQHDYIPEAFENNTKFRHALYLSPLVWDSISEVVIAAREAMDWIQECSSILSKENLYIEYTSPIGFPVLQVSNHYKVKRIETQICGRLRINLAKSTDKLDVRKQRQGSSPNLVHHVDACHMMMTINDAADNGITSFAMIHDDFGTHACDVDVMQAAIRRQFVRLHSENDILDNFKRTHEERHSMELPPIPARGTLDINEVLASDYFFG